MLVDSGNSWHVVFSFSSYGRNSGPSWTGAHGAPLPSCLNSVALYKVHRANTQSLKEQGGKTIEHVYLCLFAHIKGTGTRPHHFKETTSNPLQKDNKQRMPTSLAQPHCVIHSSHNSHYFVRVTGLDFSQPLLCGNSPIANLHTLLKIKGSVASLVSRITFNIQGSFPWLLFSECFLENLKCFLYGITEKTSFENLYFESELRA